MNTFPADQTSFLALAALSRCQRVQAAALVRAAFPSYYEPLGHEADRIIADEMDEQSGELGRGSAAMLEGEVAGITCGYSMDELAERQFVSFQHVLRSHPPEAPAFMQNVRQIRSGLPTIEGDGYYLAFIAAADRLRGKGFGDLLLRHFLEEAGTRPVYLTVRLDNLRAIAFYRKHNFEDVAQGSTFALLCRLSK